MKLPLILPILALIPPVAFSQDTKSPAKEPIDLEARRQSVVQLEAYIVERKERADALREDIIRLDGRVEKQIEKIVDKLKTVEDSKGSQVRVAQTKEQTIEGLKKTIEYYVRKRDELVQALRAGSDKVPEAIVKGDLKAFDDRIDKRIEQIIELAQSFTEHKELDKYVRTPGSDWGWRRNDSSIAINPDWRHNRKSVRHTDKETADIAKALESALDRLERRSKTLEENLKSTTLSEQERKALEEEHDHIEKMFHARLGQLEEIDSNTGGAATHAVGRDEAFDMQKAIDDAAKDLRDDFFAIFEKYDQLTKKREQIAALQKNVEARKKWLEENG